MMSTLEKVASAFELCDIRCFTRRPAARRAALVVVGRSGQKESGNAAVFRTSFLCLSKRAGPLSEKILTLQDIACVSLDSLVPFEIGVPGVNFDDFLEKQR